MSEKRTIKRYTNRKLYDKLESRYVTLDEIARLVRAGEDVTVIDNETEEDLTSVTFAQIILEEEKKKTHLVSVPFLRKLIRSGEARVQDFSDRATRGMEALGDLRENVEDRVRGVFGSGGKALEEGVSWIEDLFGMPKSRLNSIRDLAVDSVEKLRTNPLVKREVERLSQSLQSLEEAVSRIAAEEKQKKEAEAGESHGAGPSRNGNSTSAHESSAHSEPASPSDEHRRDENDV